MVISRRVGAHVQTVSTNKPEDIERLFQTIADLWFEKRIVVFDFSNCDYIGANGVAVLAVLKKARDKRNLKTEIDQKTIKKILKGSLSKLGFLKLFGVGTASESNDSMPIYQSEQFRDHEIVSFIEKELLSKARQCNQLPLMNEGLAKETKRALCELYWNIFQHANSPVGGVFAGQYQRYDKEFQICICDHGYGIAKCVKMSRDQSMPTTNALEWALEMGNSTANTGNPSGLGLHLLRNFVKVNGGTFRLYANDGVLSETNGKTTTYGLQTSFPGTLFDLRLKVRDDVKYCL